jgi:hypothetical protein
MYVNATLFTMLHFYMFQSSRDLTQGALTHFVSKVNRVCCADGWLCRSGFHLQRTKTLKVDASDNLEMFVTRKQTNTLLNLTT